jgi:hypothetical protein
MTASAAARVCVVHIGTMKTGTSSIQTSLFGARPALAAAGVRYLGRAANHSLLYAAFADEPDRLPLLARRGFATHEARRAEAAAWAADLARFLSRPGPGLSVISGEGLCDLGAAGVARLKAAIAPHVDAVRVIVYARPPVAFAQSMAQQVIKWGATFEDIARATLEGSDHGPRPRRASVHPAYRDRIGPFIDAFGRDAVTIRAFDPGVLAQGDVVEDFLVQATGRGSAALGVQRIRVNEGMDHAAVLMLESLNRSLPTQSDGRMHAARAPRLVARLKALDVVRSFRLPGFDWDRFAAAVAPDLDWLAGVTGGAVRFTLERPDEPGAPEFLALAGLVNGLMVESADGRVEGDLLRALLRHRLGRADAAEALLLHLDGIGDAQLLRLLLRVFRDEGEGDLARAVARRGTALAAAPAPAALARDPG